MVVLILLFFSTTKQTSELPSRLTPTMIEHAASILLKTMVNRIARGAVYPLIV